MTVEEQIKEIHDLLVSRLVRRCKIPEETMKPLAVGYLLNLLFLFRGENGDIGDYGATIHVLHDLIGFDGLWKPIIVPDEKPQETVN